MNRNKTIIKIVKARQKKEREEKMNRNLDGVYFRINRDGEWDDICFSDLTEEEMNEVLKNKDNDFLKRLCIILGQTLYDLGEDLDVIGVYG